MERMIAAVVGSGNIGTDLMLKLERSDWIDLRYMVGIDPDSDGLRLARERGLTTSAGGVEWLLAQHDPPELVFEATSANAHLRHAVLYEDAGIQAVDLTPAAVGDFVVPAVNLDAHRDRPNLNLISCGGQATIPLVAAVAQAAEVDYAEIVVSIASRSAGPGTRANIDEFTTTTARGVEFVGRAARGKAIIILNPADPPVTMRDTVFCSVPKDVDRHAIITSVYEIVSRVARYVPGYRLTAEPQFDELDGNSSGKLRVALFLEVEGSGDYLPRFAGNLDIMTAAAAQVGEQLARARAEESST